ncbi:MAG: hypothetical protein QHI48_01975 [Bacteroidota bacterium]|nr:hypothetical protein [Bacteroidota bacterium]
MKTRLPLPTVFLLAVPILAFAQPSVVPDGIRFVYEDPSATSVALVGDFNSWSAIANPMVKAGAGSWSTTIPLLPGTYQYAFLVDGRRIQRDPNNPLSFEAIDGSRINSMLTLSAERRLVVEGYPARKPINDSYTSSGGTVYLNLVFKHHIPLYYNPQTDRIDAPFVRMHATRDYFEMGDVIQRYSHVHATVALSPTLLWQIQEIYVKRMEPFIKTEKSRRMKPAEMDANGFLARMRGKTDPWIDICLTPAEKLTETDKAYLYKNPWNAFTISPVRMHRFPELVRLYEKWVDAKGNPEYTVQELRTLKFFAIFAHFDTEFFERRVPLIQTGTRILRSLDLRDLVSYRSDGKYYLKHEVTEDDCRRIVASAWFVMASILPNFEKVKYNPVAKIGQMEMAATSFSDAILPLIANSDVAKTANPDVTLPSTFSQPEDVDALLKMSMKAYRTYFNVTPTGYVPPYGAMSADVLPHLVKNGFTWFTSDEAVLRKSEASLRSSVFPYRLSSEGGEVYGVFSNALLTTRVNWVYRNYYAENAADDFIRNLLAFAPDDKDQSVLVTVVIDNDDAWMHYQRDTDGKGLINGIYRKLNALFESRAVISVTMTEYMTGNRERGIPPHGGESFPLVDRLGAGSRLNGNFDAWIGSPAGNEAWLRLRSAREALRGVAAPDTATVYASFTSSPWTYLFGAMSEHWFQTFTSSSVFNVEPKPYEKLFLALLAGATAKAGVSGADLSPFLPEQSLVPVWEKPKKTTRVTFLCKLVDREAITSVFIAGNRKELANMEPNTVRMWDNGEFGDEVFGNNVWTLVVDLEEGDLLYKYTNSGGQGTWEGTEAFPEVWRRVRIEGEKMTLNDVFAKIK